MIVMTIGMVLDALFAVCVAGVPSVTRMSGLSAMTSAASAGSFLYCPAAYRASMMRLLLRGTRARASPG